jgi:hypothetical protein
MNHATVHFDSYQARELCLFRRTEQIAEINYLWPKIAVTFHCLSALLCLKT